MDQKALVYKGSPPDHCCCDSTLRILPKGEFAAFFMTGGPREPEIRNHIALCRSTNPGLAWSHEPETVLRRDDRACLLSEVYVDDDRIVVQVTTHDGSFGDWRNFTIESRDNAETWSEPEPFDPLPQRGFVRNRYVASWGEWYLPIQHYEPDGNAEVAPQTDGSFKRPRNGVLISSNRGQSWAKSETVTDANAWAENNVVELSDGSMAMLIRSDGAGCLMRADSENRGRTWTPPRSTDIPNPGSKARLHRFSDGRILLVHNPNPETAHPNTRPQAACQRNPLSIWISDDDMCTWGYKRELTDFPGMLAYPDGIIDEENNILHIAFDYNRHDVIYWGAELPS
ncbi:MAG: exo-alpha-sialidase [Planctomycetes bacterium]|nr:exo-alpha-sialidase [Planctomycetota bacterium]